MSPLRAGSLIPLGGAGRCAPCARCWRGGVPSCHSGGPARAARCGSGSGGVRGRTRRLAAAPRAEGAGGCRSDTGGAPDLRSAPGPTHHSTLESCEVNPLPVPSTVELAVDRASSRRKRPDSVTTGPGLSNRAGFDPAGSPRIDERDPGKGTGTGRYGPEPLTRRAGQIATRPPSAARRRCNPLRATALGRSRPHFRVEHGHRPPCSTKAPDRVAPCQPRISYPRCGLRSPESTHWAEPGANVGTGATPLFGPLVRPREAESGVPRVSPGPGVAPVPFIPAGRLFAAEVAVSDRLYFFLAPDVRR